MELINRQIAVVWLILIVTLLGGCSSGEDEGLNASQPNAEPSNTEPKPNAQQSNAQQPNGDDNSGPCEPDNCHSLSVQCGEHPDGCGGMLNCGGCMAGSCVDGVCIDEDIPVSEPTVTIDQAPGDPSDDASATFEFSCDQPACDFECALDGQSESCQSPITYDELPDGKRHFQVRAVVDGGISGDWAEHTWIIDTEWPAVIDLLGPADPSGQSEASFSFDCTKDECHFFCALNDADFEPCESGVTYFDLQEGEHVFEVYARDWFDNESDVETWEWTIDGDVPDVVDLNGPNDPTNNTNATFTFGCSKPNCEFECAMDGGVFEPCNSGVSYDGLDDGEHLFEVRPFDEFGTAGGAAQWSWTVDTTAPEVSITVAPELETDETEAIFGFSCADDDCVQFVCALDTEDGDGDYEQCTSPKIVDELVPGIYIFNVRGIDAAGNVGEDSHIWEVTGATAFGWSAVSPGLDHSCAIANSGQLYCWGDNDRGQLGDGTEQPRSTPTQVGTADDWIRISAGSWHSCGIRQDQSLRCWGANDDGQLGDGSQEDRSAPVAEVNGWSWQEISTGSFHTCGIRQDQTLWCWGYNLAGELGGGTDDNSDIPVQVGEASDWTHVATSEEFHTCGRRANGTVWCWGSNFEGALGDGTDDNSNIPVQVGTEDGWSEVGTGATHSCGRRDNGEIWCWGNNQSEQIGDQAGDESNTPVQVGSDDDWSWLTVGGAHNCAGKGDGAVWCWGSNSDGELGDGSNDNSGVPAAVTGPSDWNEVTAGNRGVCGVRSDQSLWCWGFNSSGQLGDGSDESSNTPVEVAVP